MKGSEKYGVRGGLFSGDVSIVAYGAAKMTADLQASSLCMVQLWASVGAAAILYLTMSWIRG